MTDLSFLFLALAAIFAILDWVAVGRNVVTLEYISKPAATVAFLAVAVALDISHGAPWRWLIVALVFCLLGDIFLMLPGDAFVPGLASFAIAQIFFTISFATRETTTDQLVIGLVIVLPIAAVLARRFTSSMIEAVHKALVGPVFVYMVVISAMAVGSISAGGVIAIVGAVLFMLSDSLIAETRFVKARPWHGVGIMVTYHLALAGLVLGVL